VIQYSEAVIPESLVPECPWNCLNSLLLIRPLDTNNTIFVISNDNPASSIWNSHRATLVILHLADIDYVFYAYNQYKLDYEGISKIPDTVTWIRCSLFRT